jgi:ABC-type lipoprotein export system ATPase subunit
MSDENALSVENVKKSYGLLEVLAGVSFQLCPGESLAVTGASGAGKSTLLNIIGALEKPDAGEVVFGGEKLSGLSEEDAARYRCRRIGFVFQEHHLLPELTAWENVQLPALAEGAPKAEKGRAGELLRVVGLEGRENSFPGELSGGERQRVAIARALMNKPPLLLCDEPTGNLDEENGNAVADLLNGILATQNVTAIVVTHNPEIAARFSRRARLVAGRILAI